MSANHPVVYTNGTQFTAISSLNGLTSASPTTKTASRTGFMDWWIDGFTASHQMMFLTLAVMIARPSKTSAHVKCAFWDFLSRFAAKSEDFQPLGDVSGASFPGGSVKRRGRSLSPC